MRKLAILSLVLAPALAAPAVAETKGPFIHVEVNDARGDEHVNVQLPLSVVQIALDAIDTEMLTAGRVHLGHGDVKVADIRKMWQALKSAGDTDLVQADTKEGKVSVSQKNGRVLIRVKERDSDKPKVDIDVPAAAVDALLMGEGESLNLKGALLELSADEKGDFIRIDDGGSHVRVWIE